MYYIMNKNEVIAEFEYIKNELGTAVPQLVFGSLPELFGDMKQSLIVSQMKKYTISV